MTVMERNFRMPCTIHIPVADDELRGKLWGMTNYLHWLQGSRCRATASTGMNQRSSRSHAIFTITVEQRRVPQQHEQTPEGDESGDEDEGADDEYLCAKMHLVDLAGTLHSKILQFSLPHRG